MKKLLEPEIYWKFDARHLNLLLQLGYEKMLCEVFCLIQPNGELALFRVAFGMRLEELIRNKHLGN